MPRIDPNQLLNCLSILLSRNGGIRSKDEVQRIASLMTKFSKKLVSKCIYVLILKTSDADLLDMFMSVGGWDLTFNWLSDGITTRNWPLVTELVELLLLCPVDIERLKGNNCPKLIKMLSKDVNATEKVRSLACGVVDQWLTIVKGACDSNAQATPDGMTVKAEPDAIKTEPFETEPAVVKTEPAVKTEPELNIPIDPPGPVPVYKITIRDGKKVLAEVVSDRSSSADELLPGEFEVKQEEEEEDSEDEIPVRRKRLSKDSSIEDDEDFVPPKKVVRRGLKKKPEKARDEEPRRKPTDKKAKLEALRKQKEKKEQEKAKLTKEKLAREEKDRAVISKLMTPSIAGMGKIPKKSRDVDAAKVSPPPKDPKKYNISIETRKGGEERPKTVKTFNSKFRSTGLEEAPPPPKSVKKTGEEESRKKRSSPVKEIHPEKKLKEEPPEKDKVPVTPPPKPKPNYGSVRTDSSEPFRTACANRPHMTCVTGEPSCWETHGNGYTQYLSPMHFRFKIV